MTECVYRDDAYLTHLDARVTGHTTWQEQPAILLDRTLFYALGGGQPGDVGALRTADGEMTAIVDTRYSRARDVLHVLSPDATPPAVGESVALSLDWPRRYTYMRMHTCMHLLGAVLQFGVTGGSIGPARSRLDFDMQDTVDKEAVTAELNALIQADHPVTTRWITDEELDAQPELIRTMSVKPPRGAGRVRLLDIAGVDLQPCGGTHVLRTGEIRGARVAKVEKKGRHNRRVHIEIDTLDDDDAMAMARTS